MTDHPSQEDVGHSDDDSAAAEERAAPAVSDGVACTEAYEQDGVVVLYDAENPLAWIEADSAVTVGKMA